MANREYAEFRRKPIPGAYTTLSLSPTGEFQSYGLFVPNLVGNPTQPTNHLGTEEGASLSVFDAAQGNSSLRGMNGTFHTHPFRKQGNHISSGSKLLWKPFSCRWPYLTAMFILVATLLGIVVGLKGFRLELRQSGDMPKMSKGQAFAIFCESPMF